MKRNAFTFEIIDITELYREKFSVNTINKSCDVLSCRLEGESSFFYENEEHIVKKGDVIFIPSGSTYYQETEGEHIIYFHLLSDNKLFDKVEIITFENPEEICDLFRQTYKTWKNKNKNYIYRCMSQIYDILSKSPIELTDDGEDVPGELKSTLEYIDAHIFDAEFSFEEAMAKSYVCKTQFYKLFKKHFNCTPVSYVNEKRIYRAKQLLVSGNYTKAETAYLCGVENVKYFYTLFKKVTGYTMGKYAKLSGK